MPIAPPPRFRLLTAVLAYSAYAISDLIRLQSVPGYALWTLARVLLPILAIAGIVIAWRTFRGLMAPGRVGWFGVLVVGIQFLLAFGTFSPWLGLGLGLTLWILDRPTIPLLSRDTRRFVLFVHVATAVGWLGVGLCMTAISTMGLSADPTGRPWLYGVMHLLDLFIVIPMAVSAITTGLVLSLATPWGLFRHWWIVVKFVLSLAIIGTAATWESFWVRRLAGDLPGGAGPGEDEALAWCMAAFSAVLGFATWASIYKPWGRVASRPATVDSPGA